jgi:hypothetical protein
MVLPNSRILRVLFFQHVLMVIDLSSIMTNAGDGLAWKEGRGYLE